MSSAIINNLWFLLLINKPIKHMGEHKIPNEITVFIKISDF